ncbi:2-nonaprenyl-3-methyl-6-methoxy-1,4-benzoquinol hydroxylase [Striga asiatica]|uniref:2-nonaprenyl-3-methyl-6-methoxy-1,4-benzoquinol hydroxylase n=1 Tax=Striga asiatica TaxID=4170 RepID=A0A5A7PUD4_STRAF|nr:2-nonaprenyl-3-methyl-6-methoxy-1,4-benzoquinol hydroxylase [Striga asiatica]
MNVVFSVYILPPAMAAYLRMVGVVQLRLHNDKGNTWIVVAGLNAGSAIFQHYPASARRQHVRFQPTLPTSPPPLNTFCLRHRHHRHTRHSLMDNLNGDDSEPNSTTDSRHSDNDARKKKGRKGTRLKHLSLQNGEKVKVTFDCHLEPDGPDEVSINEFKKYLGVLARTKVSILASCWNNGVSDKNKEQLWQAVLHLKGTKSQIDFEVGKPYLKRAMTNNDDVQQMAAVFSDQDGTSRTCWCALALNEIHKPSVFNSIWTPLARDLSQLLGRSVENRAVREQIQRLRNHYNLFTKFLQRTRSKVHSECGEVRVNKFYWLYVWPEENPIERFLRTTGFKWHDECMLVFEMREAAKICFNDAIQATFDVPSDAESSSGV